MMKCYKTIITTTALMLSTSVNAAAFNFYQGGFTDGAFVIGTFTLEDTDLDNQLSSFTGELLDFNMSFSGNSLISAFSIASIESDINHIVYDLNDGTILGDGVLNSPENEGISIANSSAELVYGAGEATIGSVAFAPPEPGFTFLTCLEGGDCGFVVSGDIVDHTLELVTVSSVPVPAAVWLFGSGLIGLIGVARRKKA